MRVGLHDQHQIDERPADEVRAVLIWNGAELNRTAPDGTSGYTERAWVTSTPGVVVVRVAVMR